MPHDPYRALYVHIPFCVKRCGYCDFATQAMPRDDARIDEYLEQLILDIKRKGREGELTQIETLYIGGGTPSHLGLKRLTSLLYALSTSIDLARDGFEFTMEANPESLDENMVKDMWALGVNRLSIGVQSFDDEVLTILGRAHDSKRAREAISDARERFDNVSIDLMCGIPGQSKESLRESLGETLELGVKHVSVYPLTVEPHTPFYRAVMSGEMQEPDDDVEAEHMQIARDILVKNGFLHYEVANYAKPGYESRHNSSYWTGVPYLGLGWRATTMTQNDERRMRIQDGEVVDDLDRAQMEAEDLMLGMRQARGISLDRLASSRRLLPRLDETIDELIADGLVLRTETHLCPTEKGWLLGNELYGRLLDLAP